MTNLTDEERLWAFRCATARNKGSHARWTERAKSGLTDEQLAAALQEEIGIIGGSYGPDLLTVEYKGDGLKIWAGHKAGLRYSQPPMCHGPATLRLAREVYGIRNPEEKRLGLS